MKLFWRELKTEQLLFWRSYEAAFFTFFLPVVFFLIFGSIYGNSKITKEHIKAAPFLEAGMIGYGVASTAFAGLAITMVVRRESGVLKRVRATPLLASCRCGVAHAPPSPSQARPRAARDADAVSRYHSEVA